MISDKGSGLPSQNFLPESPQHSEAQTVAGNTAYTKPENRAFYPALDGLRAIALLLVFFQHYIDLPWGNSGVNAFFVLSGFLITGILWDSKDDRYRVRNFYVRRTLRIFPLYYGIFLLLLLSTPFLHWAWTRYWVAWPLYLGNFLRFLAPNAASYTETIRLAADGRLGFLTSAGDNRLALGHFWSLSVEEQFYLAWPWIVFALPRRRTLIWICGAVVCVLPFARWMLQPHISSWMQSQEIFYRVTPFQLDSLLLGALLALLWRGSHREQMLKLAETLVVPLFLICACAYLWTMHKSPHPLRQYQMVSWRWTFGLTLTNVLSSILLLCAMRPGHFVYRVLSLDWLRRLGKISYGAYIFHDILHGYAIELFKKLFPHLAATHYAVIRVAIAVIAFPLMLVMASLSFRYFETPFLNLKERWTKREAAPDPSPVTG